MSLKGVRAHDAVLFYKDRQLVVQVDDGTRRRRTDRGHGRGSFFCVQRSCLVVPLLRRVAYRAERVLAPGQGAQGPAAPAGAAVPRHPLSPAARPRRRGRANWQRRRGLAAPWCLVDLLGWPLTVARTGNRARMRHTECKRSAGAEATAGRPNCVGHELAPDCGDGHRPHAPVPAWAIASTDMCTVKLVYSSISQREACAWFSG